MKTREFVQGFGSRLRERIERTGLTESQFAASVGLTRATLSNYITGRSEPGLVALVFLSKKLETTPNYLLGVATTLSHESDAGTADFPQKEESFSEPTSEYQTPNVPLTLEEQIEALRLTFSKTILDLTKRVQELENK